MLTNTGNTLSTNVPLTVTAPVGAGRIDGGTIACNLNLGNGGDLNSVTIAQNATITCTGDGGLTGVWQNNGVINVPDTKSLSLGGTFTNSSIGSIVQSGSGAVEITGTLNNNGIFMTSKPWLLHGTMIGGTIGSDLFLYGSSMSGVNIASGTRSAPPRISTATLHLTGPGLITAR